MSFRHLDLIIEASLDELEAIEGLGPVIAGSVFNYFREPKHRALIEKFRSAGVNFAGSCH